MVKAGEIIEIDLSDEGLIQHPVYPENRKPSQELIQSIRSTGQITPIIVCKNPVGAENEEYTILDGHCRCIVIKDLGMNMVKAIMIKELSELEFYGYPLVLNAAQKEYSRVEIAYSLKSIKGQLKLTDEELVTWCKDKLGECIKRSTITEILSLMRLPKDILADVESGSICFKVAVEFAKMKKNSDEQRLLFDKARKLKLPLGEVKSLRKLVENQNINKRLKKLTLEKSFFSSQHAYLIHCPSAFSDRLGCIVNRRLDLEEIEKLLRWAMIYHPDFDSMIRAVRKVFRGQNAPMPNHDAFDILMNQLQKTQKCIQAMGKEALVTLDYDRTLELSQIANSIQSELIEIIKISENSADHFAEAAG